MANVAGAALRSYEQYLSYVGDIRVMKSRWA